MDSGINKHKAFKMMSDAGLKRSSFYRYLQKLKDASDSSSIIMGYNMSGQLVYRDPPVDLCMPGSRSHAESGFGICMTSLGNSISSSRNSFGPCRSFLSLFKCVCAMKTFFALHRIFFGELGNSYDQ